MCWRRCGWCWPATASCFNDRARAFDRAAVGRRRRVAPQGAHARRQLPDSRARAGLLLPWRNPVWVQYVSHKLGRLAVPYALLAIFAASIMLVGARRSIGRRSWLQVAFYLLAGCGASPRVRRAARRTSERRARAASSVRAGARSGRSPDGCTVLACRAAGRYTVVMMNYAVVAGLVAAVRGRSVWK